MIRLRRALDPLSPSPHLPAVTHHTLALALMEQASDKAEHHAGTALALRVDPHSHVAEADRLRLSRVRDTGPRIASELRSRALARFGWSLRPPPTNDDRTNRASAPRPNKDQRRD